VRMVGTQRRRRLALVSAVTALALLLAACGGKSKSTSSGGASATTAGGLHAQLPSDIQQAGEIKVGSDIEYPPIESFKSGTQEVEGLDWDLAQAMGQKLGVKVTFVNDTNFDAILSALISRRFDVVMSAMNDTPDRRAKKVDFIDYFKASTGIDVKKGNPDGIKSLDDLCGKTVAVQKGTTQESAVIPAAQSACSSAGKGKITVLAPEKDVDAVQQVKIGRAAAVLEDLPVSAYNASTSGGGNDFEVAGSTDIGAGKYGIAVPKDDTQLRGALQAALKAVIADGTYDQLLAKWKLSAGAYKNADVNTGT
jgi:polar amino acid transport system substrate-binding protein